MLLQHSGLKVIAILEASKGLLALMVAFGLHLLLGQNLQLMAEELVSHAHLNPASHLPSVFILAASKASTMNMNLLAAGALLYAVVRLVEAYGLWRSYGWTEWFALISGAIYLPIEVYEMLVHPNSISVGVFLLNLIVVLYMLRLIIKRQKTQRHKV